MEDAAVDVLASDASDEHMVALCFVEFYQMFYQQSAYAMVLFLIFSSIT